jgi:crotonobetainyl-CoA:carnitine CoA-transferase CaiB-like acyl-CoA transferase
MSAPLAGIRVLAIEQFGAGPWGTGQLADLGADVIKVESPLEGGDVGRYVPPFQTGTSSLFFETFNRGKRSLALDLRHPDGRQVFEDLVPHVDAVFSNLRGDRPAALRVRYADLAPLNERIVCVSLSGFGATGPRAAEGAYDTTIQALAGWMALTGAPDAPPTKSGISLVDFAAGYVGALGLLAGVVQARRDGIGSDVDLSLFETALSLLTYMGTWTATHDWEPRRMPDSAHQTIVPFQAFAAADGWLAIGCAKESMWRRFCVAIDRPELAEDALFSTFTERDRNRDALLAELRTTLATRTVAEWVDALAAAAVPCAPVNDVAAALADEQTAARGGIASFSHPQLGTVETVASPFHHGRDVPEPQRAPLLGEHTHDVLTELCGYDEARIGALADAGAFGTPTQEDTP